MSGRLTDFDNAHKRILDKHEGVRAAWDRTEQKRKVALMLVDARIRSGLTQSKVATNAGWDKAFVSRLESASGAVPDLETIWRYIHACGATVGLVVGVQEDREHRSRCSGP